MKLFIVVALLVAAAAAAPAGPADESKAGTLKYESDNIGVGGFNWAYETENGIGAQENAILKNAGSENEGIAVTGSFRYIGPDGVTYVVNYIADENGFQPQGAHLPVAQ